MDIQQDQFLCRFLLSHIIARVRRFTEIDTIGLDHNQSKQRGFYQYKVVIYDQCFKDNCLYYNETVFNNTLEL